MFPLFYCSTLKILVSKMPLASCIELCASVQLLCIQIVCEVTVASETLVFSSCLTLQGPLRKPTDGLSEEISSDEEEKEEREAAAHFHQPPRERPIATVGPKPASILRKRIRSPAKSPSPPQAQPQVKGSLWISLGDHSVALTPQGRAHS